MARPKSPSESSAQLSSTGSRPTHVWVALVSYCFGFALFGCEVTVLGPTLTALARQVHVAEVDLSPLFTTLGLTTIIGGLPSGWLVDRVPGHVIIVVSLILQAIGLAIMPFTRTLTELSAVFALVAFTFSFLNSAIFTMIFWAAPKSVPIWMNAISAAFGLGSFATPLLTALCEQLFGEPVRVFYIISAMAAASAVPLLFVPSPTKPEDDSDSRGDAPSQAEHRGMRWGIVAGALLIVFLVVGAEATYGYWIFSYSVEELHFTDQFAAFINSAFWGAFTAGRILGVLAAAALGPVTLLVLMLPLSIIGSALPLLVPMQLQSQWFIMATSCAVGFGNSTGYANAVSMLEMFVPVTGMINGLFGTVAGGSNMIAPVLVALLAKYTDLGFQSVMWVVLVMYLVSLATVVGTSYLGQRLKSLQLEEQQDDLVEPLLAGSEAGEEEQQQGTEISIAGEAAAAGEAASTAVTAGDAAATHRSSGAGASGPQQV